MRGATARAGTGHFDTTRRGPQPLEPLRDDDPQTIGGYTLVSRIGAGGMGRVYLGESAAGQQVAVKVIKPSVLDEDTRARFLLEVDSLLPLGELG
ncbi:hypothetical protein [Streptomyces sp. NBC_01142]|uniref:hypothetical protein n=1 Tax=Streptomyces sp. NBC_01142 TaxID=2975865 RepID=UPI002B1D3EBD|nr:hypothetical protein [Streptomyces sp. NBC_01142]